MQSACKNLLPNRNDLHCRAKSDRVKKQRSRKVALCRRTAAANGGFFVLWPWLLSGRRPPRLVVDGELLKKREAERDPPPGCLEKRIPRKRIGELTLSLVRRSIKLTRPDGGLTAVSPAISIDYRRRLTRRQKSDIRDAAFCVQSDSGRADDFSGFAYEDVAGSKATIAVRRRQPCPKLLSDKRPN
jgi:hypothetical protein